MRTRWQFVCGPENDNAMPWLWRWQMHAAGGCTQSSPIGFLTLEECIADARICGYNPTAGDVTDLVDPRTASRLGQPAADRPSATA